MNALYVSVGYYIVCSFSKTVELHYSVNIGDGVSLSPFDSCRNFGNRVLTICHSSHMPPTALSLYNNLSTPKTRAFFYIIKNCMS